MKNEGKKGFLQEERRVAIVLQLSVVQQVSERIWMLVRVAELADALA